RHLERALEAFRKSAEQAALEGAKELLAKALLGVGRVCEISIPENVPEAQGAYARIVAECPDQKTAVEEARRKIRLKGVDVYLDQYARFVTNWREVLRNSPAPLDAKKKELDAKVKAIGRDATDGLMDGLANKDEVVRAFAAELIAGAADESGLATLIAKLGDQGADIRAGAGLAIAKIFETWALARTYDQEAERILADLDSKDPADPNAKKLIDANRARAEDVRKRGEAIRGNLPANLANKPQIEAELQKLISDESADPSGRIEAAKAVRALGEISGGLIDAVCKGLESKNRSVREACCIAASGVDTTNSEAKLKLVDRLMAIVQYEPEADAKPLTERDLANDPAVRVSSAISLGTIGMVKGVPALIEALSDGDSNVRRTANEALKRITGMDLGFDPDPLIPSEGDRPMDPEDVAKKQAAKRQEGIAKWSAWWNETLGAGILVNRFWLFQSQWKSGDPSRLFDRDAYLRELKVRSYTLADPAAQIERAERACDRFQLRKGQIQQDALDLGAPAIEKFAAFLSGILPADAGLSTDLQSKSRAVTRLFVAETVAKLIAAGRASDKIAALRDKVGSGSKDEKAGAALALGFLPKDMAGPEDRDALEKRGLEDADAEVKEAAARSLARVGSADNGPALARVASANSNTRTGEAAQMAAVRALAALAPKNEDVVRALGELAGGDPDKRSSSSSVREAACDALAAIADTAAVKNRWLLRARRDIAKPVRDTATRAILAIAAADPGLADVLVTVVTDPQSPSIDRTGAALGLGDLANPKTIPALVYRIVDQNPPMALKDPDPTVRAICGEALGNMGDKAQYLLAAEKLIDALNDQADLVKSAAFDALRKIAPTPPEKDAFQVKDPESARAAAVAKLRTWLESNRGQWKELPQ
ncbi:MAG TPA: HEAT repeat domain-containing protein, partial [Planctomycetota bacterium]|nr:HEAT repeat domain-containing protein [Planctomycetota bacterium]